MPRLPGHDKWETEKRNLLETLQFESVFIGDDLNLLETLILQRMGPSAARENALEILKRLKQAAKMRPV